MHVVMEEDEEANVHEAADHTRSDLEQAKGRERGQVKAVMMASVVSKAAKFSFVFFDEGPGRSAELRSISHCGIHGAGRYHDSKGARKV